MELKVLVSVIVGFLFVIGVCSYLYFMDKYDKESKWLLISLFGVGMLSGIIIFFMKSLCSKGVLLCFGSTITIGNDASLMFLNDTVKGVWTFMNNFVVLSLLPILVKFSTVFIITKRNKNFNSLFDGIIYTSYVFLSSLLAETTCFAILNGWDLFLFRLLELACIDVFSAIIIGYYYTMWYIRKTAKTVECVLIERKMILEGQKLKYNTCVLKGLLFGMMISTAYQYCGDNALGIALVIAALLLTVHKVKDISKKDMSDENIVFDILQKNYSHLSKNKEAVMDIIKERTN